MARELHMTEAEYDDWSWTVEDRTEFVDGKVIVLPRESTPDIRLRGFLARVLGVFVEELGLGEVIDANLQIRPRAGLRRMPDLMFISTRRLPQLEETYLVGGPDLAVEIVSPKSGKRDRVEKYAEYEHVGIRDYWILDPRKRRAEAFALDPKGRYQPMPITDGILRSQAIPGFWLRLEWLWQQPAPTTRNVMRELGVW